MEPETKQGFPRFFKLYFATLGSFIGVAALIAYILG